MMSEDRCGLGREKEASRKASVKHSRFGGCVRGWFALGRASTMPNYDYLCEACGHQFEVFQGMNDAKLTDCPQANCDGKVRRLFGTGGAVLFKGSGFYQTDYRSTSYKEGAKKEGGSSSSSSSSGSSGGCGSGCGCH